MPYGIVFRFGRSGFARNAKTTMKMTLFAMAGLAVASAAQGLVAPAAADLELAVTRILGSADQYARTFQNLPAVFEKSIRICALTA
jgi:hypothetical protein